MTMYNSERKLRFIEEKESRTIVSKGFLKRKFELSSVYEEEKGKDLCQFTAYEIMDMYRGMNIYSHNSIIVMHSVYTQYVNWCIANNLVDDAQNHFMEIRSNTLGDYLNYVVAKKRIVSKAQVYEWCDELPNASDAFIILCLFEGIKGKEYSYIVNAKISDFDLESCEIRVPDGNVYSVSAKLVDSANESNSTLTYFPISGSGKKEIQLRENGLIIKDFGQTNLTTSDAARRRMTFRLARILNYLGIQDWMSAHAFTDAGRINYIIERSSKLNISPKEFVLNADYFAELQKRYGVQSSLTRNLFYEKYKEYLS